MATTVFGSPVTNETLMSLPEYVNQETLTQLDRAKAALLLKNVQGKDTSARKFADELRADYKPVEGTGCLIYNATGGRIQLVAYRDVSGQLARSPYPIFIENGQWGVFLHGRFGKTASIGAIVYEGINAEGYKSQWVLAWKNPTNPQLSVCYTDIRNCMEEHFTLNTSPQQWDAALLGPVVNNTQGAMLSITRDFGCQAFASIGNTNSGLVEAIFTVVDPKDD